MRVSTSQIYYSGTSSILEGQSNLYKIQSQLSTGRRVLTPKDDPLAATQSLITTQAQQVNKQFLDNQGNAADKLAYMDSQLGNMTDLLSSVIERSIQGGNGALSNSDRAAITEELKGRLASLVDMANARDSEGNFMFAGARNNVAPFSVSGTGGNYSLTNPIVSYNGDDTEHQLQVETTQAVTIARSGQDLFMRVADSNGAITGRSVFDALQNMIDSLDPASTATPKPSYSTALGDLQSAHTHLLTVRAEIGAQMNQVDSLTSLAEDMSLQYSSRLSRLQDVDYASAITNFTQQQTQLQATQQSFSKLAQLSLFDVI